MVSVGTVTAVLGTQKFPEQTTSANDIQVTVPAAYHSAPKTIAHECIFASFVVLKRIAVAIA